MRRNGDASPTVSGISVNKFEWESGGHLGLKRLEFMARQGKEGNGSQESLLIIIESFRGISFAETPRLHRNTSFRQAPPFSPAM